MSYRFDMDDLFRGFSRVDPYVWRAVSGVLAGVLIFALALSVVLYVFQSLGLFTMAKRRRISNYGLAWVPVGDLWIIGRLADQYDDVTRGRNMKLRHILLWCGVALYVFAIIVSVASFGSLANLLIGHTAAAQRGLAANMGIMSIYYLVSIAFLVMEYIALYRLYKAASPDKATMFLVLSIFFSVCIPFFLFALRKSDKGMPYLPSDAPAQPQEGPQQL